MHPGDVTWHGVQPNRPDFSPTSRTLAMVLDGRRTGWEQQDRDFYAAFNAWKGPLTFAIPPSPQGRAWRRVIDTALAPPLDFVKPGEGAEIHAWSEYGMAPYSLLVLVSDS